MKVLQINATFAKGSTGTIVQDIQQCCFEHGIECHVAYASAAVPQKEVPNGYKIGNFLSNNLHAVLCRICGKQAYYSYFSTLCMLRHINKIKPDIIHLHNLHSNYIHLNLLLKYLAKKKIATIVTLHDCWFYTGGCFHYTDVGCYKWLEDCGKCPKQKQDTPAYFCDCSAQILKDRYKYFSKIKKLTVVGVSQWIANESQLSVFKGRNCLTIHNGVDMNVFKPCQSDIRQRYDLEDKFVILGPASKWLAPVNLKFKDEFIKRMPADWVLFLFGCHDDVQTQPSNVITFGFTHNREELAQLYSMADVFVNCTREESMSMINVEAQACGTPVITFANTGAQETVDGVNSFKIENGDVDGLLNKINTILFAKFKKSPAVIKWIEDEFEQRNNYAEYIQLYKNVWSQNN